MGIEPLPQSSGSVLFE